MTKGCDPETTNPSQQVWKGTEKVINWKKSKLGIPRSAQKPKKARLPRKGRGGEERVFKLRNRKDNVEHTKGREFGKSAILVGESQLKPRFWENRDHSSQIPLRPAETTKSKNKRILRIKKD